MHPIDGTGSWKRKTDNDMYLKCRFDKANIYIALVAFSLSLSRTFTRVGLDKEHFYEL